MRLDTRKFDALKKLLGERILLLDGAMGSRLQCHCHDGESGKLPDLYVRDHPEEVAKIHEEYLEAGADIIETDSFNCNALSLADYGLEDQVYSLSKEAAQIARKTADRFSALTPGKPRFVAGSVGPTKEMLTLSKEGPKDFDRLAATYADQIRGLLDGGTDIILLETVFDTLNAKAALYSLSRIERERGEKIPVIVSGTVSNSSGRLLSGQTLEAFFTSVMHAGLLAVGLNCGLGSEETYRYLKELADFADVAIALYPNAGLPDNCGEYHETPEIFVSNLKTGLEQGLVNIIGGCCGTTPDHIRKLCEIAGNYSPREIPVKNSTLLLSNLEATDVGASKELVQVGERTNVAGSKKFARLIRERKFDEALDIAIGQIRGGASIIDVCMDDGLSDESANMMEFLRIINSDGETGRVPVMIDSSNWDVIMAGLKVSQGKPIVNSISLKEGEDEFIRRALEIKNLGGAMVVMLFDEEGQAVTFERKIEIARRAYDLLVGEGVNPSDIVFDPNILTVATGMEDSRRVALDYVLATQWIKKNLPGVSVSGGVSNLSFAFRGNNRIRESMHTVFLYHAFRAGLDMAIVNAGMLSLYSDIEGELLEILEDVILCRIDSSVDRLIEYAAEVAGEADNKKEIAVSKDEPAIDEKVERLLLSGKGEELKGIMSEMVREIPPLEIIDNYLMKAMQKVGLLFGEGKMFLPQVIKAASAMQEAVRILQPHIGREKQKISGRKVILATVKGDVHDIGKNIVGLVVSCNGYEVDDLGVRVESRRIVERTLEIKPEAVLLSGLISPSLQEMINVCRDLENNGITLPVIIGGAATSAIHTAVRIAPVYSGPVFYSPDAAANLNILSALAGDYEKTVSRNFEEQKRLREIYEQSQDKIAGENVKGIENAPEISAAKLDLSPDKLARKEILNTPVDEIIPYIEWKYLLASMGLLKGSVDTSLEQEQEKTLREAKKILNIIKEKNSLKLEGVVQIFEAVGNGDDIVLLRESNEIHRLPMLRAERGNDCGLSVSDFVSAERDYVALFAVTAGVGLEELTEQFRSDGDSYSALLAKLVADRLAEAFARWVHADVEEILTGKREEKGVRIAFGYPSAPDHSLKKDVFDLLEIESATGMRLTETGMIWPGESVCGMILRNGRYLNVGTISERQLREYASKREIEYGRLRRLLSHNVKD